MPKRPTDPNARVLVVGKGWMTNAERDADPVVKLRADRTTRLTDHFIGRRIKKGGNTPDSVELKVNNWADLELFMMEPSSQDFNPAGDDFNNSLVLEAQQAIEDQDETRLRDTLLLMLKAVRRV